jgi:hypothetical protein
MTETQAPGLTGDWLNGWLAAIGITVLVDGCRLHWSDERRPTAILSSPGSHSLCTMIAQALPDEAALRSLVIANDGGAFPRRIPLAQYVTACSRARQAPTDFSLAVSVTDLVNEKAADNLPHSRFDPSAPRGETLWTRLVACRRVLPPDPAELEQSITLSLAGRGLRREVNGLGFDVRRIEAGDPPAGGKYVDPVVECLVFHGLSLFPLRGDGQRDSTRGWRRPVKSRDSRRAGPSFRWPVWAQPLDRWAVDALLGQAFASVSADPRSLGLSVTRTFSIVPYRRTADLDQTTGYASRRT